MDLTAERVPDPVHAAREEIQRKAFDEARAHLDDAMREESLRVEAFNLLGVIEEVRGDASTARTNWRIALLLDPAYEPARSNLTRAMRGARHRDVPSLG
jgi:Flp pilus assembly protein TadD